MTYWYCSLTGLLGFLGSSPVTWSIRLQGSIVSNIYDAEFSALRTTTEDDQSFLNILRCLRCNVPSDGSCPTRTFGDNLSVILNVQNPAVDLSKKYVAISFHVVREAVDSVIVVPCWFKEKWNTSDQYIKFGIWNTYENNVLFSHN